MQCMLNSDHNKDKVNAGIQMDVNGTRDTNVDMKKRITETDETRSNAIQRLRVLQAERDRMVSSNE